MIALGLPRVAWERGDLYIRAEDWLAEPSKKQLFRFGVYEADLRTGELRKDGTRVRLQEQPFQVLVMLLERPG